MLEDQNLHRIEWNRTEWNRIKQSRLFPLEGTYNDHLVALPDQSRADQHLKNVIKGTVQMPFKH